MLTSAAEPAAVARLVEGATGAAHLLKRSHLAQPHTGVGPGVDAVLTANLKAEVSPTVRACFPKSSRRTGSGALATGCAPRGAKRDTHRWIKLERAECQTAGGPAGKRDGGTSCTGGGGHWEGKWGKAQEMRWGDKGEALGGIV